jgi:hypothetical protein
MIVLTIAILAVGVVESRDRVRRDSLTDDAALRSWYASRYGRRGRQLNRDDIEDVLRQAYSLRRWGPVALSAGTMLTAVVLTLFAANTVPGFESVWRAPQKLPELIPVEVLVQTAVVFILLPVLVVEGILAALYTADLDIGRLRRLLDSLG